MSSYFIVEQITQREMTTLIACIVFYLCIIFALVTVEVLMHLSLVYKQY